jgi:hypothetical protein
MRKDYTYWHLLPSILRHPNLQTRKQKSKSKVLIFSGTPLKSELDFSFVTINDSTSVLMQFFRKENYFQHTKDIANCKQVINRGKHLVTSENTKKV